MNTSIAPALRTGAVMTILPALKLRSLPLASTDAVTVWVPSSAETVDVPPRAPLVALTSLRIEVEPVASKLTSLRSLLETDSLGASTTMDSGLNW